MAPKQRIPSAVYSRRKFIAAILAVTAFLGIYNLFLGEKVRNPEANVVHLDSMDTTELLDAQADGVAVYVQVIGINPIQETATVEYQITPYGVYGQPLSESAQIDSPFNVQFSASGHGRNPNDGVSSVVRVVAGDYVGGFESTVNLYPCADIDGLPRDGTSSSGYPSDSYCFDIKSNVWHPSEDPNGGDIGDYSFLYEYGNGIDGYVITFERVPYKLDKADIACTNQETGAKDPCTLYDSTFEGASAACYDNPCTIQNDAETGYSHIRGFIQRSAVVIAFSYIVLGMIALAAVCAVAMTIAVATRSRPPALEGLAFMAALLFAVQPLRGALPDAPPVGMDVDVLLFYPCVLLILVSLALQVGFWVRRDDYRA